MSNALEKFFRLETISRTCEARNFMLLLTALNESKHGCVKAAINHRASRALDESPSTLASAQSPSDSARCYQPLAIVATFLPEKGNFKRNPNTRRDVNLRDRWEN